MQYDILKNKLILTFYCVWFFSILLYLSKYPSQDFCLPFSNVKGNEFVTLEKNICINAAAVGQ